VTSRSRPRTTSQSALPNPEHGFLRSRWFSFCAALAGVWYVLRHERNAWIEMAAGLVVFLAAWWFQVAAIEWAILALVIFLVLALEAINTAIEAIVDLVSPEFHPLAKRAKDAAAGALVFSVLGSLCVAVAIFGPRLWILFSSR
jgi:diacylglycerol kinase